MVNALQKQKRTNLLFDNEYSDDTAGECGVNAAHRSVIIRPEC